MGHEMAGEIVEIGGYLGQHPYGEYTTDDGSKRVTENNLISDNNPFEVGDRVTGSPIFGGFAEYVVADFSAIFKIPEVFLTRRLRLQSLLCAFTRMYPRRFSSVTA